jgi:FkbM family methyltransferase
MVFGDIADTTRRAVRLILPEPIYRRYRTTRVHHQIAAYQPRVVEHRFGNSRLRVSLEDPLAEGWYDHDWQIPKELTILSQNGLGDGSLLFDLGSHQGIVALIAAELVGLHGRVLAVEAEPHNARVARRNVSLNEASNVHVVQAAVVDADRDVLFAESLNGRVMPGRRSGKVVVPGVTIDHLAATYGHPAAVLLDIEGAEGLALNGAGETIRRGAMFVIEIHVGCGLEDLGGRAEEIVRIFDSYELFVSEADVDVGWRPLAEPINTRTFLFANPPAERS